MTSKRSTPLVVTGLLLSLLWTPQDAQGIGTEVLDNLIDSLIEIQRYDFTDGNLENTTTTVGPGAHDLEIRPFRDNRADACGGVAPVVVGRVRIGRREAARRDGLQSSCGRSGHGHSALDRLPRQ